MLRPVLGLAVLIGFAAPASAQVVTQPFGGGTVPVNPQLGAGPAPASAFSPPDPVTPPAGGSKRVLTSGEHMSKCAERYPSYDPKTNTYVGRDGRSHICP
jgi:hypothetical protein